MAYSEQEHREILTRYIKRVDERAQQNMMKTGQLSGSHYAAMRSIWEEMFPGVPFPKVTMG